MNPAVPTPGRRRRASALMTVMWVLLMLGISIGGVIEVISYGVDEGIDESKKFRARMHAESGLTLGLHPLLAPGDPVLVSQESADSPGGFRVRITRENGRIGINYIYLSETLEIATREMFKNWGLDPETAATVTDSLMDWMDSDQDPRPSGAEAAYYSGVGAEGFPLNADFTSLDQMLLVRGMDKVDAIKPDWRNYFTVYGDGLIEPNDASADVLRAVTEAGEAEVERFLSARRGGDGIDGTEDDRRFTDLKEVQSQLAIPDDTFASISTVLTLESTVLRIESQGWIGDATHTITLVVSKVGQGRDAITTYLARLER